MTDQLQPQHQVQRHDVVSFPTDSASFGEPSSSMPRASLRKAAERPKRKLLVLLIDLDKWINDALGHAGGDAALAAVGRCGKAVRRGDVVALLGGDQFIVLLEDAPIMATAMFRGDCARTQMAGYRPASASLCTRHAVRTQSHLSGTQIRRFTMPSGKSAEAHTFAAIAKNGTGKELFAHYFARQAGQ